MIPVSTRIKSFFNPEFYQGWSKKKKYFEGWYFKIVNQPETLAFAIIPGVAMDEDGNRQAFIQVLDGMNSTSVYHRFDFDDFIPSSDCFEIRIKDNFFSENNMILDLPGLKGHLKFAGNKAWPKHWYSPGIMGPYSFVPFMECYHGIVSMDHSIYGKLQIPGEDIDFENGRGYIEKDWGRSFPSWYIWMQSNHFNVPGISVKASVADIPWIRNSFTGFIAGIQIHEKLYQFTTYNGTKLKKMESDVSRVSLLFENSRHLLEIDAYRSKTAPLASPVRGFMDGRIEESMTGRLSVKLIQMKDTSLLFEETGRVSAIEVMI